VSLNEENEEDDEDIHLLLSLFSINLDGGLCGTGRRCRYRLPFLQINDDDEDDPNPQQLQQDDGCGLVETKALLLILVVIRWNSSRETTTGRTVCRVTIDALSCRVSRKKWNGL
jgi:hypothetical protein